MEKQNRIIQENKTTTKDKYPFLSSMNSYLGIMKHYNRWLHFFY